MARWIDVYKTWRGVVHHGVLRQGSHHGRSWLQARAEDGSAALVILYRRVEEAPRYTPPLRVAGLGPARRYRLQTLHVPRVPHSTASTDVIDALVSGKLEMSGAQLAELGLPLPPLPPESAILLAIREIPP